MFVAISNGIHFVGKAWQIQARYSTKTESCLDDDNFVVTDVIRTSYSAVSDNKVGIMATLGLHSLYLEAGTSGVCPFSWKVRYIAAHRFSVRKAICVPNIMVNYKLHDRHTIFRSWATKTDFIAV